MSTYEEFQEKAGEYRSRTCDELIDGDRRANADTYAQLAQAAATSAQAEAIAQLAEVLNEHLGEIASEMTKRNIREAHLADESAWMRVRPASTPLPAPIGPAQPMVAASAPPPATPEQKAANLRMAWDLTNQEKHAFWADGSYEWCSVCGYGLYTEWHTNAPDYHPKVRRAPRGSSHEYDTAAGIGRKIMAAREPTKPEYSSLIEYWAYRMSVHRALEVYSTETGDTLAARVHEWIKEHG